MGNPASDPGAPRKIRTTPTITSRLYRGRFAALLAAADALRDVWPRLTPAQRQEYLDTHPAVRRGIVRARRIAAALEVFQSHEA